MDACALLEEAAADLKLLVCRSLSCVLWCRAARPQEKHSTLVVLWLVIVCLRYEDFHICMLFLYLQCPSAHADKVRCPTGLWLEQAWGTRERCFPARNLPPTMGVIDKSVSLVTADSPKSDPNCVITLISEIINTITPTWIVEKQLSVNSCWSTLPNNWQWRTTQRRAWLW